MFLTYCAVSKQLNYIPNLQARNLKKQTSTTIGVLLPSVSNPFYPSILRGIEDEAVSNNYAVLFASCDRKQSDTDRYLQDMLEHNVRGIIRLSSNIFPKQPPFTPATAAGLSVWSRKAPCFPMHTISPAAKSSRHFKQRSI